MAAPWSQVEASAAYQQLPPDQQQAARAQYFSQVVAPQVPTSDLTKAWGQFTGQSGNIGQIHASMPDTLQSMVQQRIRADAQAAQASEPQRYQQALQQNAQGMPWYQQALAGAGKSFVDTGRGVAQLVGLGSSQNPNASADSALMNTTGGMVGYGVGQVAQTALPMGVAGDALRAAGMAGRAVPLLASAIGSGAFAGAQPADSLGQRALNTGIGFGLGGASEGLARGVAAAAGRSGTAGLSLAKREGIALAQKYGIPLHLSQVTGSKPLQILGSMSKYLPLAGTESADAAQRNAWNNALLSTVNRSGTDLTPGVMADVRSGLGKEYDDYFASHPLALDDGALSDLAAASQRATAELPQGAAHDQVQAQIDRVLASADGNGTIAGPMYQNLRNSLKAIQSQNPAQNYVIGDVRNALEDAAQRQGDDGFADINRRYSNYKVLGRALKRAEGANYGISPATLYSATTGKFGATPEMQALARMGQTVLKDPIQNSGTAQRYMYVRGLLGGAGAAGAGFAPHVALPMLAAGATVGRTMNSPLAARALPALESAALRGGALALRPLPLLAPQAALPLAGAVSQ